MNPLGLDNHFLFTILYLFKKQNRFFYNFCFLDWFSTELYVLCIYKCRINLRFDVVYNYDSSREEFTITYV